MAQLPQIPDEIVLKAILARGHGHQVNTTTRVGIGAVMLRALEAVYQDLIDLYVKEGKP